MTCPPRPRSPKCVSSRSCCCRSTWLSGNGRYLFLLVKAAFVFLICPSKEPWPSSYLHFDSKYVKGKKPLSCQNVSSSEKTLQTKKTTTIKVAFSLYLGDTRSDRTKLEHLFAVMTVATCWELTAWGLGPDSRRAQRGGLGRPCVTADSFRLLQKLFGTKDIKSVKTMVHQVAFRYFDIDSDPCY